MQPHEAKAFAQAGAQVVSHFAAIGDPGHGDLVVLAEGVPDLRAENCEVRVP